MTKEAQTIKNLRETVFALQRRVLRQQTFSPIQDFLDEADTLRNEVERLRGVLQEYANEDSWYSCKELGIGGEGSRVFGLEGNGWTKAQEALQGGPQALRKLLEEKEKLNVNRP